MSTMLAGSWAKLGQTRFFRARSGSVWARVGSPRMVWIRIGWDRLEWVWGWLISVRLDLDEGSQAALDSSTLILAKLDHAELVSVLLKLAWLV